VARRCAGLRPERVHVFPPSLRAALLAFLSGCRHRRGYLTEGRGLFLNEGIPLPRPERSRHQADLWLEMVTGSTVARDGAARPELIPGEWGRTGLLALRAASTALASPGGYAVLAPAASFGPAKEWPARYFRRLAQKIQEELGLQVVAVGGRNPREQATIEAATPEDALDLSGQTDLPTLAALLAEAAFFVGNDSGPMHLAAAVGIPTLGIFGSTSPTWTAPRGARAAHVGPYPVDCSPCFLRECAIGLPCLENLGPEKVWDALAALREGGEQG
jgi:heptosyltransferase-2